MPPEISDPGSAGRWASASGFKPNQAQGQGAKPIGSTPHSTAAVVSRGGYMQEQPERQALRQFLDFMRIGDTESAYQAVEKMKFSDFVDALEAVHAKEI